MNNLFNQFMQNPVQFMTQRRLNVPRGLANDPQGIVQHLMNTGQMSQQTYDQLRGMMQK